jgi:hypothetical protein
MANTFIKIASVTVGSGGAASMDFTSIPGTYTDLCIKVSARASAAVVYGYCRISFNGDTASNFRSRILYGDSGTVGSTNFAADQYINGGLAAGTSATSSTFSNFETYIPNYAGSTQKSVSIDAVSENNSTTASNGYLTAGLWTGTAAITSIALTLDSGNFVQYSTATLYGIKKN